MATPRLGLVVEDKPTEFSCIFSCPSAHIHVSMYCFIRPNVMSLPV